MIHKKILSPRIDFVFRLLFGDQRNIRILTAFLKAALDLPPEEYGDLAIVDPHLKKETEDGKSGVVDVKVHTRSGKTINVELQVATTRDLRKRFAWYGAKMLTEQISRGDQYGQLERVISIIIVDGDLVNEDWDYYNRYVIMNPRTGTVFTDLLEINVLDLSKLPAEPDGTALWTWGRFFKSESEEEFEMVAEKDPEVKETVVTLMELSEDEANQMLATSRMMYEWDQWAIRKEQYEKGMAQGLEKGQEQVLDLLDQGYTVEQIKAKLAKPKEAL
jgi:predicted transposase/invertase (TIGR01784 family)